MILAAALFVAFGAGAMVVLIGICILGFRILALRVIGARPRRKVIQAATMGDSAIRLPPTPEAAVIGECVLRFGPDFQEHSALGRPSVLETGEIVRAFGAQPPNTRRWPALITAYPPLCGHPLSGSVESVVLQTEEGYELPAWYVAGDSEHWAIHVQGIRTSRAVTLRSMERTVGMGLHTLSITFRSAGELDNPKRCSLGQNEWRDLLEAARFAEARGAKSVTIVGWSMGAGIALEFGRRFPQLVTTLVLVAPATDWPKIITHGAKRAGLPRFTGKWIIAGLGSRFGAYLVGLSEPIQVRSLTWMNPGDVTVPTLVIHSPGDQEIPYSLSMSFARSHGDLVELVEFPSAPHAWEANVDPEKFTSAFHDFLHRNL